MIKSYKKECDYSYTLGIFLTIELLKVLPEKVYYVALSSKSEQSAGINKIKELCAQYKIACEVNDKQIDNLSPKENCFAIGFFKKYDCTLELNNHIVLVNPADTGNLGNILRSMAGFEFNSLAIIKPGVDIFDPKTVRASMGAIFHINFEYFDTFENYSKIYPRTYYPFMLSSSTPLQSVKFIKPYSLVFGNESSGLNENYKNIGKSVVIPHSKLIDSLNLQTAVVIALYSTTIK